MGGITFWVTGGIIITIIFTVIGIIIGIIISVNIDIKTETNAQIVALSEAINQHLEKARSGKTLATREKNCLEAINLLETLLQIQTEPKDKAKTKTIIAGVKAVHKVLTIEDFISKAERAEFKNQKKRALNYYIDALLECRNSKITDQDMILAQLKNDHTKDQITLSWIKAKAKELGWQEKSKNQPSLPSPEMQTIECPSCNQTVSLPEFNLDQSGEGACPYCGQKVILKDE